MGAHRFYTFNVADMGVTLGGAALFLAVLAENRAERRTPAAAAEPLSPPPPAAAPASVAAPETPPQDAGHV